MCDFLSQLSQYSTSVQISSPAPMFVPISLLHPTHFYISNPSYTIESLRLRYKNYLRTEGPFFLEWLYSDVGIRVTIFKCENNVNVVEFEHVSGDVEKYGQMIDVLKGKIW